VTDLAIIVIMLLLVLIVISSIDVNLNIMKKNEDNKVIVKIKMLYGLIRLKKELGDFEFIRKKKHRTGGDEEDFEVEVDSDSWTEYEGYSDVINLKKIKRGYDIAKKYKKVIDYIINKINFQKLLWKTEVGLDDAALTGFTIGIINILKSNLLVMLNSIEIKPKNVYFKVVPDFNSQILKTNIDSIFKIKIGYIIIAGLKFLWIVTTKK